jgi:hypothetical protein
VGMEKKVEPVQANDQQQPATDDAELAKVLEGVTQQAQDIGGSDDQSAATSSGLQFEEAPMPAPAAPPAPPTPAMPGPPPAADPATPAADPAQAAAPAQATLPPELENLKKDALDELRPLIPKLDLPPEDKFNTILLVIRSTDDQSLLGAAHDAAKSCGP